MPKNPGSQYGHIPWFLWVFSVGTVLRVFYFLHTPYNVRSYDWEGHVEYIRYVMDHWTVPPVHGAWQFFQPPLYYFLAGAAALPARLFGGGEGITIASIQLLSLVLSLITLGLGIWIACIALPKRTERRSAIIAAGIIAVFPALIFFSSRISNDVLLACLSFAFFAFLLRWWKEMRDADWYAAWLFAALGILTKSNGVALIAIGIAALLLRKALHVRKRALLSVVAAAILVAVSGPLLLHRFGAEGQTHVVGNIGSNNPELRTEVSMRNFLSFRPMAVLEKPFNSSWNDEAGRDRFWEHLLKSAFVGEWDFGRHTHGTVRLLLLLSIATVLAAVWKVVTNILFHPRTDVPMWSAVVVLIGSMMALFISENVGGFQDFRYVPLLVVPVTYYALRCVASFPQGPRRFARRMLVFFTAICAVFILQVAVQ